MSEQVPHRRPKIGEHLEVLDFAPQHRELALELPRSYREKAVARFKRMTINLRDPSDWEDGEIRENLSSLARIYQKKAGYVRAHAERKRLEVWEAKRDAAAEDEPSASTSASTSAPTIEDMPPLEKSHAIFALELETEVAIAEVVRSMNRKLWPAGRASYAKIGDFCCGELISRARTIDNIDLHQVSD